MQGCAGLHPEDRHRQGGEASAEQPGLKSEVTGEEKVGRIDHETGRVYFDGENAIPYRYKNVNAMVADEWQLFWSAPSGTTVTWNTTAAEGNMLPLSGTIVNRNMSYLPQNGRFDKTEAANYIVVANDTSSRAYKVVFTSAEASKNADLGKVQLAWNSVTKFDDLNTKTPPMLLSTTTIRLLLPSSTRIGRSIIKQVVALTTAAQLL